jgi:RND family efflux transporter MFP subunit
VLKSVLLGILLAFPVFAAELPFLTAPVTLRELDETYAAEASVEAVRQSTVSAQISGRIVEVNFDVGDRVKKGQILVRIDEAEVQQSEAGSEARVAQARANLLNARLAYERSKQLLESKFISQAAVDQSRAEFQAAEAQLKAAQAGAGQASTTRSFATVIAPYSGVVSARHIELGEMAAPGKPLMTGFDPAGLRVVASIPQYKLEQVRKSAQARVEFPEVKRWVDATAVVVQPVADSRTHTSRARVSLPDGLEGVYPGMFARVHFSVGRTQRLTIPLSAVVNRSEVTAVYVVDSQQQVSLRQVRLGGATSSQEMEVLSGLAEGELIATEPVKAGIFLKGSALKGSALKGSALKGAMPKGQGATK